MNITIIGGGWLGLPLAQELQCDGHHIIATKRSEQGVQEVKAQGLEAITYTLGDKLDDSGLAPLFESELVIINIPPGRKNLEPQQFITNMKSLISHAFDGDVEKLIFVSTSAVYGNKNRTVYEYSAVDPITDSAQAHVEVEHHIRATFGNKGTIVRLSGLVDDDRHPARSLSGRADIANGQQVVNLVHRTDVITAIEKIIQHQVYGQTLHLAAPEHPTRAEYYIAVAKKMGIDEPSFLFDDSVGKGKSINCELTLRELDMELKYTSPFDMYGS